MSLPEHLADLERRIRAQYETAVAGLRQEYDARLRRASEAMLASLGEVHPPAFEPLADIDAAAFTPRRGEPTEGLAALLEGARALDRASGQAAVLDALLVAARRFAARVGLLLTREDGVTGWASAGFDGDPFAGCELAWDGVLPPSDQLGRGAVRRSSEAARSFSIRLGVTAPATDSLFVPLVLRDRVAAALYVDNAGASAAPALEPLQLLVQLASARLELQALCERDFSPTLFASGEAVGAALPLWAPLSAATPSSVAAPATPSERAPDVAPEVAPPPAVLPTMVEPPPSWTVVPEVDLEPEPVAAAELPAPEPAVEPEPLPSLQAETPVEFEPLPAEAPAAPRETDDSLWGASEPATDAGAAGFSVEDETPPAAPPEPMLERPLGDATVRIPAFRPAEPAAPAEALGLGTRRIPQFTAPPAIEPTAAPVADLSDDATVLLGRGAAPAPVEPPPPAPGVGDDTADRTGARAVSRTTEVAPPPDLDGPGSAFAADRVVRSTGDNALHDEARRLARLLVSEIKLYNEEQVLEGRRNRDLYVRLKEDIDRSRQIYDERVHDSVRSSADYFHQELVRSLAGGDPRALGL